MKKLYFFLTILCLVSVNLSARVVYVDSSNVSGFQNGASWATAYSSFQVGINSAHASDSVWVAKATYSPAFNTSFSMKDSVKIFGGFTNTASTFSQRNIITNTTILKGSNASVFLNNHLSNRALLDGFTITGGKSSTAGGGGMHNSNGASPTINNCIFLKDTADNRGGAIRNYEASPIINNCTFSQNVSRYVGGAICNSYHSMPVISNCSFTGNKAYHKYLLYIMGGAIYNEESSFATISNCSFTANEVQSNTDNNGSGEANGGAICNDGGGCKISNCTFSDNLASNIGFSTTKKGISKGAAIYSNNKLNIENCTFSGNIALTDTKSIGRGTIYSSYGTDSTHVINNSVFTKNNATQGGAIYNELSLSKVTKCIFLENKAVDGGAVYNKSSAPLFINCVFSKDTAATGGAMVNDEAYSIYSYWKINSTIANCLFIQNVADSFGGAILNQKAGPKIVNSTIVYDTTLYNSGLYGGGIYNRQNSFPSISNTIVWSNISGIVNDLSSVPSVFYSLVQGYAANATNHLIAGTTDPLFEDMANGNFKLQYTSPCINKGRNDSLSTSITTDINGKQRIINDTIDIGAYEYILSVDLGRDTLLCAGDTLILNAGNTGSTYLWNTGAITQTIKVTASGKYYVTVTNPTGISADTINIQLLTPLTINLGNDTSFCTGNSLTITSSKGATYLWNTSATTRSITINSTGTYIVKLTAYNGCITRDTINITVNPLPVASLGNDTAICIGSTLTLNAQNTGATYLWNDNSTAQTLAVSAAGTYNVLVTDTHGCKGRDTININTNSIPIVALGNDTTICTGTSLTLDAQNTSATYLWNTTATTQTISIVAAGSYNVSVTDANGCSKADTIAVSNYSLPVVALGNDTAICIGTSLTLDAQNAGAAYVWNTTATTQTITVNDAGSYNVTVTDANNCISSDTIQITVNPLPLVNLGNDTTLFPSVVLTLDAGNTGASYLWNTGATTQSINVDNNGTFSVKVIDANECSNRDTIIVHFIPTEIDNIAYNDEGVTVTPNPAKDYIVLTIKSTKLLGTKVVITDMSGRNVLVTDIHEAEQKISLQNLVSGIYLLKLQNNIAFRIIKED